MDPLTVGRPKFLDMIFITLADRPPLVKSRTRCGGAPSSIDLS